MLIQSVDRALRMLLELQGARNLSLSELSARLDLSPSTVHGLIRTLVARDLVRQDAQTQRYHLGPAVLRMAGVYLDALDLRSRAMPWARDLVTKTGAPARVAVRSGDEAIVVHNEQPADRPGRMAELGIAVPAHSSALGKAILAFEPMGTDAWTSPLTAMTSATITNLDVFRDQLDTVRLALVAIEREESVIGENSVAAPIFGPGNRVLGAISVVLEANDESLIGRAIDPVKDVANAISRELGAELRR